MSWFQLFVTIPCMECHVRFFTRLGARQAFCGKGSWLFCDAGSAPSVNCVSWQADMRASGLFSVYPASQTA
ncbi:hypothetical protein SXCC_04695 [Gluconacetobacter sp. SXCC-1]|nr:hypothetical protein SXCC_04695 [Gluconacetobacter sp. SXCC-1]